MSSLVERIELAIQRKGVTFNRVEHDCGFGGGTIKRWARQSPRFDKLVAVARYLDVSLDYLAFGVEYPKDHPTGEISSETALSEQELDLIQKLRQLADYQQEELYDLVDFKYQRITGHPKKPLYTNSQTDTNSGATA